MTVKIVQTHNQKWLVSIAFVGQIYLFDTYPTISQLQTFFGSQNIQIQN